MSDTEKVNHELVPTVGWATVRLGQSIEETKAAVAKLGYTMKVTTYDNFMWTVEEAGVHFQFINEAPPRLANLTMVDGPMIVRGIELLGLRIDEALAALKIQSYSDTMWSIMDPEDEFEHGIPLADSEQPSNHDSIELLRGGTLWIHSLGLGLGMNDAHVCQVALRDPRDTPKMGCGPLTEQTLLTATDPAFQETAKAINAELRARVQNSAPAGTHQANRLVNRLVLTSIALAMFLVPAYLMFRNYSRWSTAAQVTGKIVALNPETFPDFATVEYAEANTTTHTVELPIAYVSTREIGGEVELLYALDAPNKAVTLSKRFDQIFEGYSPFLLVTSPAIAIFLIGLAFPEFARNRNKGVK